jgi:hypothetical protein
LYWVYEELQLELQKGSNVKILLFFTTLSATVPRCGICTKSTYSTSSHQAEKNRHVDKQIEILRLIALAQPDR